MVDAHETFALGPDHVLDNGGLPAFGKIPQHLRAQLVAFVILEGLLGIRSPVVIHRMIDGFPPHTVELGQHFVFVLLFRLDD